MADPADLGLAANSVSTLVNQLAGAGCLLRETDPADRRAARLLPTPAAETRLREWRRHRAELVRRHVSRLDEPDRRALHAAIPALRKPADTLHEEAEESWRGTPPHPGRRDHATPVRRRRLYRPHVRLR